ncbi:IclR family transcriptional regulator [Candidimonas sp. SYP-B2681]|uniref:IclR family transcriptional regulator n=1 Tax=Candidimonas sp. SYP-B2681 TaxID=2497686 RepID=UPI000F88D2FE|nr:IclR family transcriptional regulator [Candidimonas sp. SYP-B2681]RTZ43232.1 IclR family transcriptional regulator [Candidimonas sp. SYP-B2681]
MTDKKPDTNVKTALRVIEIIEIFARETKPLSLSELARHLDAPVSSCLGLLRTLAGRGYLYEAGRRQGYYPTGRLLAMAQRISSADPILEKVQPSLEELRDTTRETVVFAKLDLMNKRVVYLDVLASPHPISYVAVAGALKDIHANSLGKALLSTLDVDVRKKMFSGRRLQAYNERTLVTIDAIEADIKGSRERGWFANLGESMDDVGAIAWPVKVSGNDYAISIAGPLYRIESNLEGHAQKLRVACRFLEQNI